MYIIFTGSFTISLNALVAIILAITLPSIAVLYIAATGICIIMRRIEIDETTNSRLYRFIECLKNIMPRLPSRENKLTT